MTLIVGYASIPVLTQTAFYETIQNPQHHYWIALNGD